MKTREEIVEALTDQMLREAARDVGIPQDAALVLWMGRPLARELAGDIVGLGMSFIPIEEGTAIMCMSCGAISRDPTDVANERCGPCSSHT